MNQLHYYFPPSGPITPRILDVDLCAYGQSPGAITAAIEASRRGLDVALVINSAWLGGLTSGGLGNTDIGNKRSIGGLAREFYRRVGNHYGVEEEWRFEPHVAEKVLTDMLREAGLTPHFKCFPVSVEKRGDRLVSLAFDNGLVVRARQFIDASYEGDLMALAGVHHTIGREGNSTYGETLNGVQIRPTHQFESDVDPYVRAGDPSSGLLPGIHPEPLAPIGTGDSKIQAYNFRMCLTQAADRLPFRQPDGYEARDYELLARYFATGWNALFHKFDRIRGHKTDTNNHGAVSTDFIGGNWDFPAASWSRREQIFQAHVRWQQGLMWFLSHDPRVPADLQCQMRTWGLAADEFADTGGWSRQLYIREARRLLGEYVVTEHDCRGDRSGDCPVGLGAYAMDSHNCQRVVHQGRLLNEGDVQVAGFAPYPIPYRALVPRRSDCVNLLVPVCLSASHIAYGSIRMEPVFMILGQSAAIAADLAIAQAAGTVQDVREADLTRELVAAGQVVCWTSAETTVPYEPEAPVPVELG
jgi:hypothetical protein